MVTVTEFLALLAGSFFYQLLAHYRLGIHGYQRFHTVTTVNIQCLRHRAKAMGGIHVTTMLHVVVQTPAQLVIFSILPIMVPKRAQIMYISTLRTDNFTEHAMLRHVQRIHLEPVIAAVLQNEAMLTGRFTQVNQIPAFLQIHGRRHFYRYILSILQRTLGNGEVMQPVCSNINQIYIITFAEFLVSFVTGIDGGFGHGCLLQELLTFICTGLFIITKSHYLRTRNISETLHCSGATHTQTNKTHTDCLQLRSSQSQYTLLSCRTLGSFDNNGTILPFPLSSLLCGLHSRSLACACTQYEAHSQQQRFNCSHILLYLR